MFTFLSIFRYAKIEKGGEAREDEAHTCGIARTPEAQAGRVAVPGLHSQRIHTGGAREGIESSPGQGAERTVSDGTCRTKRLRFVEQARYSGQDRVVCPAVSRREGAAVRKFHDQDPGARLL